ncbi:hypothetical protein [Trichothermofontia sp.]
MVQRGPPPDRDRIRHADYPPGMPSVMPMAHPQGPAHCLGFSLYT